MFLFSASEEITAEVKVMPPKNFGAEPVPLLDEEPSFVEPVVPPQEAKRPPTRIVWRNVFVMGYLHLAALYGVYCMFCCKPSTLIWGEMLSQFSFWSSTLSGRFLAGFSRTTE